MVASGALLLATDALSIERTHGSYILSACDFSKSTLTEFSYLQGSAELLLKFAETYDAVSGTVLNRRMFNATMQANIAYLRAMLLNDTFAEMCPTLTSDKRTELTVKYSDDMQAYILAVDELRKSHVIPFILRVHEHLC